MSLTTGRLIIRNNWTEVPMPSDVITRVETMAENKAINRLTFGDRHNVEDEVEDDADAVSVVNNNSEESDVETTSEGGSVSGGDEQIDNEDVLPEEPHARNDPSESSQPPARVKCEDTHVKIEPTEEDAALTGETPAQTNPSSEEPEQEA